MNIIESWGLIIIYYIIFVMILIGGIFIITFDRGIDSKCQGTNNECELFKCLYKNSVYHKEEYYHKYIMCKAMEKLRANKTKSNVV
jgi:hypothetical protein